MLVLEGHLCSCAAETCSTIERLFACGASPFLPSLLSVWTMLSPQLLSVSCPFDSFPAKYKSVFANQALHLDLNLCQAELPGKH